MTGRRTLAVLGGAPAFDADLHVGRPNVGDAAAFLEKAADLLRRRWLTNNGPFVLEFERRVAELLGVRECVAMCNGTVALELAIRATGMRGEVIVPSFTFVATAHALQWQGITPVFCDVDPVTHTLDPARVEALITPRTGGILGVHLWGRPCPVEPLEAIADRHGIALLFDAAHAFGSAHRGRMVGGFGAAEVFSFHATKVFNTFEGGAVATDDEALAGELRLMRNFGFSGFDEVTRLGTNGKMTEICAAMGLVGLDHLSEFIATNRRHLEQYAEGLRGIDGLRLADAAAPGDDSNHQYVVVEVDEQTCGLTRDELVQVLWAERVRARRYFHPGVHRMEPYRSLYPDAGTRLGVTEQLCRSVLVLPTGTGVSAADIELICATLATAVAEAARVRAAVSR